MKSFSCLKAASYLLFKSVCIDIHSLVLVLSCVFSTVSVCSKTTNLRCPHTRLAIPRVASDFAYIIHNTL